MYWMRMNIFTINEHHVNVFASGAVNVMQSNEGDMNKIYVRKQMS
jgi:hypothetical protein